ncbi:MAG: 8-amino-7-oxononanoate synthase [Alphaproteobacteria bacterium]
MSIHNVFIGESIVSRFQDKLGDLEARGRLRALAPARGIDFTSNDYLGLRSHPALRQAAIEALQCGIELGAGGSRLLRGNTDAHEELEAFASAYFGCENALYFSSGFQANAAIFQALPQRGDTIIFDTAIHASAREGIQASVAGHIRVPHNDLGAYEEALRRAKGKRWIAVESVYSMDGDLAPLPALQDLALQYDAFLIVDEAHGTGVFGASGRGLSEGLPHDNLITLHTCGKALGVAGGLVCARADIIDYMINTARGFIYSTAPMPLQAVLVKRALELVRDEPERREKLHQLILYVKYNDVSVRGVVLEGSGASQIMPILLGEDARAVAVARAMQTAGFDVRAIRPPTVPEGTARLRVSLGVHITEAIWDDFRNALGVCLRMEAA